MWYTSMIIHLLKAAGQVFIQNLGPKWLPHKIASFWKMASHRMGQPFWVPGAATGAATTPPFAFGAGSDGWARLHTQATALCGGASPGCWRIHKYRPIRDPSTAYFQTQFCYNVRPPSDVSWFIKSPSNHSFLHTINHSYWSYKPT